MMTGKDVALWIMGATALLLLVASMTGTGTGLGRTGWMTHMLWSYVIALGLAAALVWAFLSRANTESEDPNR